MKKIGIFLPPKKSGGVYQYGLSIGQSLMKYSKKYHYYFIRQREAGERAWQKFWNYGIFLLRKRGPVFSKKKAFKKYAPDLVILPTPSALFIPEVPFLASIPDLMYKYYRQLPDYPFLKRVKRDIIYSYFSRRSLFTIADSEQGKEDLVKFFRIEKEKIRIIPYIPPDYIFENKNMAKEEAERMLKKYRLPEKFIFYPAQFWHHKNHKRLILALEKIKKEKRVEVPLVLTGGFSSSYKEVFKEAMNLIKELKMEKQIIYLGYVSELEMVALYKKSLFLVFPTLIGPTSIPPLEAQTLGAPVLCSNLFDMPRQLGEGALYFNPFDVDDMKEKIWQAWRNSSLRERLKEKGKLNAQNYSSEKFAFLWEKAIKDAFKILK